ncbi:MAG: CDP-diacylglycerol--serine O-phosphatidyltransferase [Deltaproteobacteria bacterium]|nr:CDP-diacylglycerol--serine O-phosphatidyltransferase [Deltaproteobacteria bacterium]MBI4224619.1 CDP-diacylglycerol--serine O-phosphatidyltransferase [Deltaproteobacteria bacterium]
MRRRGGIKKGIYILPNLCTTASLFCGFFAVIKVLHGNFVTAAWAILLAGLFDLFDGQLARLTKAGSQFGIEYDSLVDLASFGLAPSLLLYMWALRDFNRLGWIVAFLFFACGALRLARFNVQAEAEESHYFQGLPIPMSAYMAATTVIFYDRLFDGLPEKNLPILGLTVGLALLMVSTVRYRNARELDIRRRLSFFVLVGGAGAIAFIAWKPSIMMWVVSLGYVAGGPIEEVVYLLRHGRRRRREPARETRQPVSLVISNQGK